MPDYDFCITGAGCAGLSLLVRMLSEPALQDKKILVIDRDPKTANDRTWCFWEKEEGFFGQIVSHRWSKLWFHNNEGSRLLETAPYVYKMIRGIDFYNYCLDKIRSHSNVEWIAGNVDSIHSNNKSPYVIVDGQKLTAGRIFNSIPFTNTTTGQHWRLLQHFKGWTIRSLEPAFNPAEATVMDFRVTQQQGACFFYVLPFTTTQALVECTFFSGSTLPESVYTDLLIRYIRDTLKINDYVIMERELGVIPMTTATLPQQDPFIRNIGAAAGLTKPSTGYTFQFIQDDSARIVSSLVHHRSPPGITSSGRFRLYDRILLNVLITQKLTGYDVFSSLFSNATASDILAFLDNSSNLRQDYRIIRTLPKLPFIRAAAREIAFSWPSPVH